MKKLLLVFGMTACIFGMTACGGIDESAEPLLPYGEDEALEAAQGLFETIVQVIDQGQAKAFVQTYPDLAEAVGSVEGSWSEIGAVNSVQSTAVEMGIDEASVTVSVDGESHDAEAVVVYDSQGQLVSLTVSVIKPFGELMTNAALNTLLGMGTVFAVLILIAWIISLFKNINKLQKSSADRKKKESAPAPAAAPAAPVPETAEEPLEDDGELVAVIAAAVAAYESETGHTAEPGEFVVRSIRRRSGKWQRA